MSRFSCARFRKFVACFSSHFWFLLFGVLFLLFWSVLSLAAVIRYSFLICSFISAWWFPLPLFPSTCNFPFLRAFWLFLDLAVLFFVFLFSTYYNNYYWITPCDIFTPKLADRLSRECNWKQVSYSLKDSSRYSDRPQQFWMVSVRLPISNSFSPLNVIFWPSNRPKMPFKVMHRKEVTHSNGSYERKSRGWKLADEMGRAKKNSHGTLIDWCTGREWPVNCMTVISAWWRLNMRFQRSSGR